MLTARIEAGQREECVAVGEAVGVKSEVCEALLAVVEDLAVVLLVGPRHVVVVIEEGAVCLLQLGEDGELLEVSRRLGRDVDGSERRVELPETRAQKILLVCSMGVPVLPSLPVLFLSFCTLLLLHDWRSHDSDCGDCIIRRKGGVCAPFVPRPVPPRSSFYNKGG